MFEAKVLQETQKFMSSVLNHKKSSAARRVQNYQEKTKLSKKKLEANYKMSFKPPEENQFLGSGGGGGFQNKWSQGEQILAS